MKIIKYIVGIILIVLVALLAFVFFQPDEYDVSRSKVIQAPDSVVFAMINEYKSWEDWGPWYEEDSTIVETYPEQTSGEGAFYTWTSKDGTGRMETIEVIPNQKIVQTLQFDDYTPSQTIWELQKVEGGTKLTWRMKGEDNPFIFKIFATLSGGMENMLAPMLEKGLDNIDALLAKPQ